MFVQLEVSVNMVPRKSHLVPPVHSILTTKVKIARTVSLALLENTVLEVAVGHLLEIAKQDTTVHLSQQYKIKFQLIQVTTL